MVLNTHFIIILSMRGWILNEYRYDGLYMLFFFMIHISAVTGLSVEFDWYLVIFHNYMPLFCSVWLIWLYMDREISCFDWDWTFVLSFYVNLSLDLLRVLYRIHRDVYLQNVILLLKRWNKIMFFFQGKKINRLLKK